MKKLIVVLALIAPLAASAATLVCRMQRTGIEYVVKFADGDRDIYFNSERFHQWSRLDGKWASLRHVGSTEYFNDVMELNDSLIQFGRAYIEFGRGDNSQKSTMIVSISRTTGSITITGDLEGVGSCDAASDVKKF